MASYVSSTFTTGDRRKKAITYGKLSRPPPPRPSLHEEDAPSPERPHKSTATTSELPAGHGGLAKSVRIAGDVRTATTSADVFDVPSDDEFESPSMPIAKRSVAQQTQADREPRTSVTKKSSSVASAGGTAARHPPKAVVAKSAEAKPKSIQGQAKPQRASQDTGKSSRMLFAGTASQAKVLQATEGRKQATSLGQQPQRSSIASKNASRATTPGSSTHPAPKALSMKPFPAGPSKKVAKAAVTQDATLDVFDVPSDDEDASLPAPEAPRQVLRQSSKGKTKQSGSPRILSSDVPRRIAGTSIEPRTLQNRKRKGSVSLVTMPKSVDARAQGLTSAQRDHKVPKRENRTSPGHEKLEASIPRSASEAATVEPTINKPSRSRNRTVPLVNQPKMSKGQSSPAVLHRMLPVEHVPEVQSEHAIEIPASDDTMYDIPDPMTTPVRSTPLRRTTTTTPGSVTPRQKDLFSTLLGNSTAPKTPASALASLQLSDKKPKSLLGALARSKSDITYSGQPQKTRLIARLKDEDTSSEEDNSESGEEADNTIISDKGRAPLQAQRSVVDRNADNLELDGTTGADSQTSQISNGAATRPRLTYASQRSYLQEANPEDELFMSMELDDNWKLDSQTVSTDDEDGPASQVKTHHELKKYGQNTMFSWDMEESIREISDGSNRSGRRSAMMDLCTKLADAGFVSQLLDSGYMHKLLENISSTGDVIFDFTAAVAVLFVLQAKPTFAVVEQIYQSGVTTSLINLVHNDADISRIARDRKSNMSKIAQESLSDFRALVLAAKVWLPSPPEKASPQVVALKTIDDLTRCLRESGSTEALLTPAGVSKIVGICLVSSKRIEASKSDPQDLTALDLAISSLETVSVADQDHFTWPTSILQQLSEAIPIFFVDEGLSHSVEAMKLCMNLTNNKPKACEPFSNSSFVQSLIRFIVGRFDTLQTRELDTEHRTQVLAALTLSLGAMINLAELSDQARINAIDDLHSIKVLVKTFLIGSERAAEASSVEESEVSVVIGFLTVLLGNLCLNSTVRSAVRAQLPEQQLDILLDKMKEFARIHQHVDKRTASRFEGPEGKETLSNYYVRIMDVVERLERAEQ